MNLLAHRLTIVTGHYGCGKTNLSINLALGAAQTGDFLRVADFDIVNPYFRAADSRALLEAAGAEVLAPTYAGTNLDIPALPPAFYALFEDRSRRALLDVGGDDAGAAALGRFARLIREENDYSLLYVVNARRILTQTPEDAVRVLREIEAAGHVPATGIVNNTNLGGETDADVIRASLPFAREVSRLSGLPLLATAAPEALAPRLADVPNLLPVRVYVTPPWGGAA